MRNMIILRRGLYIQRHRLKQKWSSFFSQDQRMEWSGRNGKACPVEAEKHGECQISITCLQGLLYNQRITSCMAQHNKENHLVFSNQQKPTIDQTKSTIEARKTIDTGREQTGARQEMLDDVRAQVYDQQRKNRRLYAQITQTNPHFAYQLHRRQPHAHHQYALLREHEQLLQEEAFLSKELAKTECIGQLGEAQKDCFAFLVQIWEGKGGDSKQSQDKIDELNKKISFLKTSVKECTVRVAGDHFAYSSIMITKSKEYQQISQKYNQSIEEFSKKEQQFNEKSLQYQERIRHLQKKNEDLANANKGLQSKMAFYSEKTNELFGKITKLTNQLADKQRKLNEALNSFTKKYESTQKCAQSSKPQFELFLRNNEPIDQNAFCRSSSLGIGRSLQQVISFIEKQTNDPINDCLSFANSEVLSQISFESMDDPLDDKENSQASITSEDLQPQSKYALSSTKKIRNSHRIRQVLFSQSKNRLSFEPSTDNDIRIQQTLSKPLKFLRKK